MAVFAGPKTVSDGLVFQIDQDNTQRSFKGKPTINYWYENGGGGATIIGIDDLPEIEELAKLLGGKRNIKNPRRQSTQTNWLDLYNSSTGITVQPGEKLRISCYVYTEKSTNRFNANANWGATLGTNAGMYASPDSHNIEPYKWHRITWSKENTTESSISVTSSRIETYSTGEWSPDTIDAYCTNPQWEVGDFTTPFVAGTRSNTQAVIDIVGSNTVTSGVTYTSDGLFEFDGSDDYLSTTNWNTSLNTHSIEMWTYHTTSGGIYSYYLSDAHRIRISDNGTNISLYSGYSENGPLSFNSGTNSKTSNNWHYVVCTLDFGNNSHKIYIDGKLKSTATTSLTAPNLNGEINIGCHKDFDFASPYYYSFYDGKISQTRLYSKALTADEVVTNFEASRDRYGV